MSTNANLERYVNKVFRNKYRKKEYKDKVFHHTAMSSYVCIYIYIYIYIHNWTKTITKICQKNNWCP